MNTSAPTATRSIAKRALDTKVPPHSMEAEQSVLGGLMLDSHAWDKVADRIGSQDFYDHAHQVIFDTISDLVARQKPLDVLTLSDALKARQRLDEVGGEVYLFELAKNTPSAANITAYADIVRERSVLRQLIQAAQEIADQAFRPEGREATDLLDDAERRVFSIAEQKARSGGPQKMAAVLSQAVERIDTLYHSDSDITGAPTGYKDLDRMTAGLQSADLIVVAGRPSMGKTAFSLNIAENIVLETKKPVLIFSMEMPAPSLAMRMISSLGRIDQHKVRTGQLNDEDWPRITSAVSMLSEVPLFIDDTPALTPAELRARARRIAKEHGDLGLIVVDYLQLMRSPATADNRALEVSEISRSLKALAKELDVPLIALSQLNRGLEQRTDKRPVMSDLRECVIGETIVNLADGRRVPIKDLVGEAPEVLAVDKKNKLTTARSDKVWKVGKKPVYKVHFASGRSITATAEHRLYMFNGWQRIEDISEGDRVGMFNNLSDNESLKEQANNDLFWDRVVKVAYVGEEDVYDLTVPGPACWLADGIVSHNSGAIEQDSDVIMFIYRDEVYHEETAEKGVAEIIIGKQRNGPIGKVRLTFLGQYTRFESFTNEAYPDVGDFQ